MSRRVRALNPIERHKWLLRQYDLYHSCDKEASKEEDMELTLIKTDYDTLKEQYRFIRTDEDDERASPWERALAQKYYQQLFREYAIIDLSRYKEGKFGCRWRTKQEVIGGKGQFVCGAKQCNNIEGLDSFEVPFAYIEDGRHKHALVKVRLCQEHAMQLNYKRTKKIMKLQRRQRTEHKAMEPDNSPGKQKAKRKRQGSKSPEAHLTGSSKGKGLDPKAKLATQEQRERDFIINIGKTRESEALETEVDDFLADLLV